VFSLAVGQRRLDILAAFAERQQVSAAARSLQVTQPAISMALRDWESSVGVALFDRTAAGVSLNDAGRVLLLHVRRSLAELRLAAAEIAAMKGVLEGHVTVGALPFARPYMLPVAIAGLLARHPTLSFSTIEGTLESLMGGLRSGDIDLVVGALRPTAQDTEFVREELFAERMAIIARRGHPLLAGTAGSVLADAARYAWILPRAGSPTRDALSRVIELLGTSLRVAVESSDLSVIRGLLLESDLLTAASPHLFHHELAEGLLQTLPIELPATSRPIGILRRTHDHSSPAAQLLIEEMRRLTHVPGDVPLQAAD
jgi:LysR family transcriptional regulator of gallate degradation